MDVTKSNVGEVEPIFDRMLKECDFIAIDTEFTGMPKGRPNPYDLPEERYRSRCLPQKKYLIVQYGICGFKYDKGRDAYIYYPFNFYVFPSTTPGVAPDQDFGCMPSCMSFLAGCGFNFTKLVNEGVPFIRADLADTSRDKLDKSHDSRKARFSRDDGDGNGRKEPPIPIPDNLIARMIAMKEDMTVFMQDATRELMVIEDCRNPFVRKLIFQEMEEYEGILVQTHKERNGNATMVVTKGTKADGAKLCRKLHGQEFRDLEGEIGFTKFILKLAKSNKPIVGHNLILDVVMTIGQFLKEFPENLAHFKADALQFFSSVYDTKVMSMSEKMQKRIPSSILGDLIKIISSEVFQLPQIIAAENFPEYKTDDQNTLHEAGFDAFVTGVSFIGMALALAAGDGHAQGAGLSRVDFASSALVPFKNKLNSMISDIPYFDLDKEEPTPDRSDVFYVTFPAEWKTSDIMQMFEPCGRCFITWINDTSAFVRVEDKGALAKVAKVAPNFPCVNVKTYQAFARENGLNGYMECDDGGFNRKRKLSGSENEGVIVQ